MNGGSLDGAMMLRPETVAMMAQNQIGDLEAADNVQTVNPSLSNDFDFMPESRDRFGLGFLINTEPVRGGRSAGSLAWAGLYNTYYWIDQEQEICAVLMTQIVPFFDAEVLRLLDGFERAIYDFSAIR